MSCKIIQNSQFIVKNIKEPDDSFLSKSKAYICWGASTFALYLMPEYANPH